MLILPALFVGVPAHAAVVTLNKTTLSFGDVLVGHTSSSQTIIATALGSGSTSVKFPAAATPFSGAAKTVTIISKSATGTSSSYSLTPGSAGVLGETSLIANSNVTATNGVNSQSTPVTLTGTAVAPIEQVAGAANKGIVTADVLVGQTASIALTVTDAGHGDLAGADNGATFLSNLHGTVGAGSAAIVGAGGSVNLTDGQSKTFDYNYTATQKGVSASTVVTTSFANGDPLGVNAAYVNKTTLTGIGVAPVNSVSAAGALARFNAYGVSGSNGTTSSNAVVSVNNTGNGNLSGLGSTSNLNGSVGAPSGAGSGSFSGPPAGTNPISLTDGGSTKVDYTFTPTTRGASSADVTASFSNGSQDGANNAQNVIVGIGGQGVGPTYDSALDASAAQAQSDMASSNYNTPTANTGISDISFGTVHNNSSYTLYLDIADTSTDPNGGNTMLTDLSLLDSAIIGPNSSAFSFAAGTPTVLNEYNGTNDLVVPITFHAGADGVYSATLTFLTDESAGFGQSGDTFTYQLTASAVPEPATWAMMLLGFAGLGFAGYRRARSNGVTALAAA